MNRVCFVLLVHITQKKKGYGKRTKTRRRLKRCRLPTSPPGNHQNSSSEGKKRCTETPTKQRSNALSTTEKDGPRSEAIACDLKGLGLA